MKKILLILISLQLLACSNEKKEPLNNLPDQQEEIDTSFSEESIVLDSLIPEPDSTAQTEPLVNHTIQKNKYPKRKFTTNVGEKDSTYLAYEWSITFFVANGQNKSLDKFTEAGFPIEWWATAQCAYYPVEVDSVSYFLNLAREMGYKDYGFDCEKVDVPDFDAALSNSIEIKLKYGESIDSILEDYRLELKEESTAQLFVLRTINKTAKELIRTVESLNKDERVERASFKFKGCNY